MAQQRVTDTKDPRWGQIVTDTKDPNWGLPAPDANQAPPAPPAPAPFNPLRVGSAPLRVGSMNEDSVRFTPQQVSAVTNPVRTFSGEALAPVNPFTQSSSIVSTFAHPLQSVKDYGASNEALARRALQSYREGNYGEAGMHALYYLLNGIGIGSGLDSAADDMKHGEYAKGMGKGTGLGLALAEPTVIQRGVPVVTAAIETKVIPAVKAAVEARAAAKVAGKAVAADATQTTSLLRAIPPSKTTPYDLTTIRRARPYMEAEHGTSPITTVEGLRDAFDSSISQMEQQISQYVDANPNDLIRNKPLDAVRQHFSRSARADDLAIAMKELESFGLDKDMTVKQADAAGLRLNAENKAQLKKNQYDAATARLSDPAFAAREIASQQLRGGVYKQLEARGISGVRDLRLDEGALIQMRNAAERQIYSGDKAVPGLAKTSTTRKIAAQVVKLGSVGVGSLLGPVGGVSGSVIGDQLGGMINRPALTHNALVEKAFKNVKPGAGPTYPSVPAPPVIRGMLDAPATRMPAPPDPSGITVTTGPRPYVVIDPKTGVKYYYASQSLADAAKKAAGIR